MSKITRMSGPSIIATREVAARMGVSVPTVNRQAKAGLIPFVTKLPGTRGAYVFDAAQIDALVAETSQPAPDATKAAS